MNYEGSSELVTWTQVYDPLGHWWLSTLLAALPIVVLLGLLAGLMVRPHLCAIAGQSMKGSVCESPHAGRKDEGGRRKQGDY